MAVRVLAAITTLAKQMARLELECFANLIHDGDPFFNSSVINLCAGLIAIERYLQARTETIPVLLAELGNPSGPAI